MESHVVNWTLVLVFLAGMSIGTMFGVVLMGLLLASRRNDESDAQE
jgi:uncharacterized membrane protein YfcA